MAVIELELKAVVPDPDLVRARVLAAGATPGFRGYLYDRRLDRAGTLTAEDQVLRVRAYKGAGGHTVLGWKGRTERTADGYKSRPELEVKVEGSPSPLLSLFKLLGYEVVHTIDRVVETYTVAGATLRLEWYPRMDVLIEVEGTPACIEEAITIIGLPRAEFTAESLTAFTGRYRDRTGRASAVSLSEIGRDPPEWPVP
jgi:adenylate cyclase class IV